MTPTFYEGSYLIAAQPRADYRKPPVCQGAQSWPPITRSIAIARLTAAIGTLGDRFCRSNHEESHGRTARAGSSFANRHFFGSNQAGVEFTAATPTGYHRVFTNECRASPSGTIPWHQQHQGTTLRRNVEGERLEHLQDVQRPKRRPWVSSVSTVCVRDNRE